MMLKKIAIGVAATVLGLIGFMVQLSLDAHNARIRLASEMVFPLDTTKAAIKAGSLREGELYVWDVDYAKNMHHHYLAADIRMQPGTAVRAARGGLVVAVDHRSTCEGRNFPSVTIRGLDNLYYYYAHLTPGSIKVKVGGQILSGENFATVGPSSCAQNTAPHLHLDVSRVQRIDRYSYLGRILLIDPQSALINAYQELPEK
jgi:hypothetical protein